MHTRCFTLDAITHQHVEAGLRDSERRLREVLEALPAAVYTTDAEGRITFYNQAAVDFSGRTPELGNDKWCVSMRLYRPDGTLLPHDQCPMAVALKENRPVRGVVAVAERPDGTRVPFLAYPTPLRDGSGALVGAVNMLVDITERNRAEELRQQLASIVESSDDAIVTKDLNGIIATWNQAAERLFGYKAEEVVGKAVTILIPPGRHDEEPGILDRIRRGERVDHYETVRRRKDGSLVEVSLTVSPVKNAEGRIIGASKIARDIAERRQAQEQQTLLLREMSHRVKNLFAVASAVVALSARFARTPQDMAQAVRERLDALTRAYELTRPGLIDTGERINRETTLHALLRTIFRAYVDPEGSKGRECVIVNSPHVQIGGNAATSLALIMHELATNAAKYGALSTSSGCVQIGGSVEKGELRLTWKEHGGPPLSGPPEGEGFGSFLTHRTVTGQFGGQLSRDWKPEGLVIHLSVPLERLTT